MRIALCLSWLMMLTTALTYAQSPTVLVPPAATLQSPQQRRDNELPPVIIPEVEELEPEPPPRQADNPGADFERQGPGLFIDGYFPRQVRNQDSLTLLRTQLNAGYPLYRQDGNLLLFTTTVQQSQFWTNTVLPDSQRLFPSSLWNVNVGLIGSRELANGWTAGFRTAFGSASDRPFASIDEMNVSLAGFLKIPTRNDRDAWQLSLFYQPAGVLNFPIPGVAYQWNPNEEWRLSLGLPFSIRWRPNPRWTFRAMYLPLTNITASATFQQNEWNSFFAAYESLTESYFLADRVNLRDRLIGIEQRLVLGWRRDVGRFSQWEVRGGYSFGVSYGEGRNQGSNLRDQISLEPGPFLGLAYRLRV